ncbi:MAG: site-2 protease family protein, partial [Acidimicrobiia bacterium]|nr:site-2 protease family protein [Acidimicrobiia bacterium]
MFSFTDNGFIEAALVILILIPSIIVHEVSHGFVADRLGDPTARQAGRLTLNPLPHIDPFGSV